MKQHETSYDLQSEAIDYYYNKVNQLVSCQRKISKMVDEAYEHGDEAVIKDIRNKYDKVTKALSILLDM